MKKLAAVLLALSASQSAFALDCANAGGRVVKYVAAGKGISYLSVSEIGKMTKALNQNAAVPPSNYKQPRSRPLEGTFDSYNGRLFDTANGRKLQDMIEPGDIVLDIGGGTGRAMFELALQTLARVFVINTQRYSKQSLVEAAGADPGARFRFLSGFVEDILPRFKNRAKLIVDMWGAFSYSPAKAEIVEAVYAALKPGGQAVIYVAAATYEIYVNTPAGKVRFVEWLVTTYPGLFSLRPATAAAHEK
ncbi:MAG TPA: class I SAM-dependent methyltransferase, partial [Bdellovibrionales bacterium]|nr:class I SAM-dependent methyltransferase [Bdellovibrionales bacterium]